MMNSGENIGVSIVLNQALPTGIDLYAESTVKPSEGAVTFNSRSNY